MTPAVIPGACGTLGLTQCSLESPLIVGFEAGKGSIEHFPPRNDNDVEACGAVGSAKYFTGEAFGAVPIDG